VNEYSSGSRGDACATDSALESGCGYPGLDFCGISDICNISAVCTRHQKIVESTSLVDQGDSSQLQALDNSCDIFEASKFRRIEQHLQRVCEEERIQDPLLHKLEEFWYKHPHLVPDCGDEWNPSWL
jgi:hypothetical protein